MKYPQYRTPEFTCTSCGYEMDMCTNAFNNRQPRRKDISLCMKCGEVFQFGRGLKLHAISPENFLDLPMDLRRQVLHLRNTLSEVKIKWGAMK